MAESVDPPERLLRLIARAEPRFRQALLGAVAAMQSAGGSLDEIARLIEAGLFQEAVDSAVRAGILQFADEYAAIFTLTGRDTASFLGGVLDVVVSFDQTNDRAVSLMRGERLRMIREFTAQQIDATRTALVDGIQRGLNPRDQARNFRSSIGLTVTQQQSVQNYRAALERGSLTALQRQLRDRRFDSTVRRAARTGEPLTADQIDHMTDRYRQRFIRYRSEVIARTEALRAVHSASEEAYAQAIDEGVLDPDGVVRTWVAARDARVRDSHVFLNGLQRGVGETFPGSEGPLLHPGDPSAPASETIQCRCTLTTRITTL